MPTTVRAIIWVTKVFARIIPAIKNSQQRDRKDDRCWDGTGQWTLLPCFFVLPISRLGSNDRVR
jgi:hypothetical protein